MCIEGCCNNRLDNYFPVLDWKNVFHFAHIHDGNFFSNNIPPKLQHYKHQSVSTNPQKLVAQKSAGNKLTE